MAKTEKVNQSIQTRPLAQFPPFRPHLNDPDRQMGRGDEGQERPLPTLEDARAALSPGLRSVRDFERGEEEGELLTRLMLLQSADFAERTKTHCSLFPVLIRM